MQRDWKHVVDVASYMGALLDAASMKFLELGSLSRGQAVLDLACGDGSLTAAAAAMGVGKGGVVFGLDACPEMIEFASRAHPVNAALRFEVRDVTRRFAEPGSFDASFCRFALPFLANPAAALANALDALKPGGRMCIMSTADAEHNQFIQLLEGLDSSLIGHVLRAGKPETIAHQLETAGFQQVLTKRIRALVTVSDPADYWNCIRGLFGFAPGPMPRAIADRVVPGMRMGIAVVFAIGRKPDPAAPLANEVQTADDAIALARRKTREISPTSLSQTFKGEQVVFVDVRAPSARVTKIKDSINVTRDDLEKRLPALVPDPMTTVVVYCQSGNQSALATGQLRTMGYTNVWSLQRGIDAWEYVGMKVVPA